MVKSELFQNRIVFADQQRMLDVERWGGERRPGSSILLFRGEKIANKTGWKFIEDFRLFNFYLTFCFKQFLTRLPNYRRLSLVFRLKFVILSVNVSGSFIFITVGILTYSLIPFLLKTENINNQLKFSWKRIGNSILNYFVLFCFSGVNATLDWQLRWKDFFLGFSCNKPEPKPDQEALESGKWRMTTRKSKKLKSLETMRMFLPRSTREN